MPHGRWCRIPSVVVPMTHACGRARGDRSPPARPASSMAATRRSGRPTTAANPHRHRRAPKGPEVADARDMEIRGTAKLLRPGALLTLFAVMAAVVALAAFVAGSGDDAPTQPAPVVLPTGTPIGCLDLSPVAQEVPCGEPRRHRLGHDRRWRELRRGVRGHLPPGHRRRLVRDPRGLIGPAGRRAVRHTSVATLHRHITVSFPGTDRSETTMRTRCSSLRPVSARPDPIRDCAAQRPARPMRRRRPVRALVVATLATALMIPPAGAADRDIDGDGSDDLLVGVPLEDLGNRRDAGLVHVAFGPADGAGPRMRASLRQGGPITGIAQAGDAFGGSVELVDIDADGYADAADRITGRTRAWDHRGRRGAPRTRRATWSRSERYAAPRGGPPGPPGTARGRQRVRLGHRRRRLRR